MGYLTRSACYIKNVCNNIDTTIKGGAMNKLKTLLVAMVSSLILTVTLMAAPVSAAQLPATGWRPAAPTSSIDMEWACRNLLGDAGPFLRVVVGNNVMTWQCEFRHGFSVRRLGLDLNLYCRIRRGQSARAFFTNFNNPYTWGCYVPR
jgi:hypothetical protein